MMHEKGLEGPLQYCLGTLFLKQVIQLSRSRIMRKIKVEFLVEVPEEVSDEQAATWIRFNLGYLARLDAEHPLSDESLRATSVIVG